MKYLSIFIALILFCVSVGVGDAAEIKIMPLQNADFESWSSISSPNNWAVSGTVQRTDSGAQSGSYCCLVGGVGTSSSVSQTIDNLNQGDVINVNFWAKDTTTTATGRVDIIFKDSGGSTISTQSNNCDGTIWKEYTGSYTAPVNTASVTVSCFAFSANELYDNFHVWITQPVTSSETFENSIAVANIDYIPDVTTYGFSYIWGDITWSSYPDSEASTSTIDGSPVSATDSGNIVIFTETLSGSTLYEIEITRPIANQIDPIYPTDTEIVEFTDPYNQLNISWDDVSDQYLFKFGTDLSDPWYNITTTNNYYNLYLNPDTYVWSVQGWDETFNTWTYPEIYSFTIGDPVPEDGYISIRVRDEVSQSNISSFTVELSNSTNSYTKSTSTGIIEYDDIVVGEYDARITSVGYAPRSIVIDATDNVTAYLPVNTSTNLVSFTLIDYTNRFKFRDTRLRVTIPNDNGGIVVSDSYFDASGTNNIYMLTDIKYSLELVSLGYTKGMGTFTPTKDETISLVVGDIEILPEANDYAGFNYEISKTNESVGISWVAPHDSLENPFTFVVYDTNDTIVYSMSSEAPVGVATYYYDDPTQQYKISIVAETKEGTLRHTEFVTGETNLIDLQLPDEISDLWYNMISMFILLIIGLTFGAKNASVGAFILAIFTGGFYAIGLLRIDVIIVSLVIILGVAAILRGRI